MTSASLPIPVPYRAEMHDGQGRLDPREVHDFWPRVLASPVLGALVTNLSGLIDSSRHSMMSLIGSYAWFAIVAFVIWEGNRRLYFRMPRREDWLLRPWRRLALLLAVIVLYTIPVATALLWTWRLATGDEGTRPYTLTTAVFAIVGFVVVITHVYETVFLLRDWESDRLRSARIEQARLQTELESLGREVDPHFLFNSLNTLSHLVERRSQEAAGFITNLGATYRYVLESRGRLLVPLADELRALERHRALADISYRGGVHLDVQVEPADAERLWLPPVSLAELFQNALKHNATGPERPMRIRVRIEGATLVFENEVGAERTPARSTGLGLANLAERFKLTIGLPAAWERTDGRFVVRLPLAESDAVRTAPGTTP